MQINLNNIGAQQLRRVGFETLMAAETPIISKRSERSGHRKQIETLKEIGFFEKIIKNYGLLYRPSSRSNLLARDTISREQDELFKGIHFPKETFSFVFAGFQKRSDTKVIGSGKNSISVDEKIKSIVKELMGEESDGILTLADLPTFLKRLGLQVADKETNKRILRYEVVNSQSELKRLGIFFDETNLKKVFFVKVPPLKSWAKVHLKPFPIGGNAEGKTIANLVSESTVKKLFGKKKAVSQNDLAHIFEYLGFKLANDEELHHFIDSNLEAKEQWRERIKSAKDDRNHTASFGVSLLAKKLRELKADLVKQVNISSIANGLPMKSIFFTKGDKHYLSYVASTTNEDSMHKGNIEKNLQILKSFAKTIGDFIGKKIEPLFVFVNKVDLLNRKGIIDNVFSLES